MGDEAKTPVKRKAKPEGATFLLATESENLGRFLGYARQAFGACAHGAQFGNMWPKEVLMASSNAPDSKDNLAKFRLFLTVTQLLAALSLPVVGWALTAIMSVKDGLTEVRAQQVTKTQFYELSNKVGAIEANRFNASHGLEVWKEIHKLREDIAKVPTEVPPRWFLEEVRKIAADMQKMQTTFEQRLDKLSDRVNELKKD